MQVDASQLGLVPASLLRVRLLDETTGATSFLASCPRVGHSSGPCVIGINRILSLDRRTLGDAKVVVSLPAVQTGPISLAVAHR